MRWQGRRESDNVEDRRSSGGGGPSMGGPGFRLPSGKGGIILLVVVLVAGYYGVDLTGLMTGETGHSSSILSAPSARMKMKRRNLLPLFSRRLKIPGVSSSRKWGGLISRQNW